MGWPTFNLLTLSCLGCATQILCRPKPAVWTMECRSIYTHTLTSKKNHHSLCQVKTSKPWPCTGGFNQSHSEPVTEGLYKPDSVGQSDTALRIVSRKSLCRGSFLWFTRQAGLQQFLLRTKKRGKEETK
jgi:hypothetical protein